ncbi:MAG TPA: cytochrome c [Candidatus Angelobacter sp.]|nr:cytochrome c [Candidatus Angelobacter sp.]
MKLPQTLIALTGILALLGCKASAPSKVESTVANEVKHEVTVGGKDVKNPIPYSADAVKEGEEHFGHHCGICHGLDGQATGVPFASKMQPPVPDLTSKDVQDYADGQLKWIIENGIGPSGMPGWKGELSDEEMWNVVHFLRHLPAKGSLGIPAIYKEEAEEHEHAEHEHGQPAATPHTHKH